MKLLYKIVVVLILLMAKIPIAKGQSYLDPKASVEERVNDLLPRLTSAEKLSLCRWI